jgi:hypothetical protein
VGADKLGKIISAYPQISADWLISGKGEMMKKEKNVDDTDILGPIIAGEFALNSKPLNREEMKTVLLQMTGILSAHQQELARLITELEQNGKRSDRILDMMERAIAPGEEQHEPAVADR